MKNKKLLAVALLLVLGGCSTLENVTGFSGWGGGKTIESTQGLIQHNIQLDNGGAKKVLDDVKFSWTSGVERQYNLGNNNTYEIYVGEYFKVPSGKIAKISLIGKAPEAYDLNQRGGFYYFRTIYQGVYSLNVVMKDGSSRIIKISNIMKYKFTENETYDIIRRTYNSARYRDTQSLIDLYHLSFPNNSRAKELSLIDMNVAMAIGDFSEARTTLKELKITPNLSGQELAQMFNVEIKLNGRNYNVDSFYLDRALSDANLTEAVKNHLLGKNSLTANERNFLNNLYAATNDPVIAAKLNSGTVSGMASNAIDKVKESTSSMFDKVKSMLTPETPKTEEKKTEPVTQKNVDTPVQKSVEQPAQKPVEKVVEPVSDPGKDYTAGKTAYSRGRYSEAAVYFNRAANNGSGNVDTTYYLGDSHFKSNNYDKAVVAYQKYVDSSDESVKKAESLYNMGIAYEKLGNKDAAIASFQKAVNDYPGTSWARKSNIYLIKLRK